MIGSDGATAENRPQAHSTWSCISRLGNGEQAGRRAAEADSREIDKAGKRGVVNLAVYDSILVTIATVNKTESKEIRGAIIIDIVKTCTSTGDRVVGERRSSTRVRI